MSGWIIPVVIAAVAVAVIVPDIIDNMMSNLSRQAELIKELNRYKTMTESVFCRDPNSPTCQKWTEFAEASGYNQREDESEGIFDRIGKGIATGAKFGLGIGIAVIAIGLAMAFRKK